MTRPETSHLTRTQRSVFFYWDSLPADQSLHTPPDFRQDLYPHMLIEDVQSSIVPIGGSVSRGHFTVSLNPHQSSVEAIITVGLCPEHRHDDLAAAACCFIGGCAQQIMAYGDAFYEIGWFATPEGKSTSFELVLVPPRTVHRRWGKLVQHLPKLVATKRSLPRWVNLSEKDILHFVHPIHPPHELRRLMQSLSALSAPPDPSLAMHPSIAGAQRYPYDFNHHARTQSIAIATVTRSLGWDARETASQAALYYYTTLRHLRFERFKIQLRDAILATLNHALLRVGQHLGFAATLQLEGLPTLPDVDAADSRLKTGAAPFDELLQPFLTY